MRGLLVVLFAAAAAFGAGQDASLPDGGGKAIIAGACSSCHGVDLITGKKVAREEWAGIIERMKGYGATLDATQTNSLLDYLVQNFGPAGAAPAVAGQNTALDAAGSAIVNGNCSSCHGADLITSKKASRADWQGTVDRMKGYGATLDDAQTATLLDYLVAHYGPKESVAAADAGKEILEGYCSTCHDLDLVSGRTGTQAEWQDVVDRMNGRGAGVPESDVAALVQYLTKTYGTQ